MPDDDRATTPAPAPDLAAERRAEAAEAEARAASKKNPRLRILTGVVGAGLMLFAFRTDVGLRQSWCLVAIMAACCLLALRELFHLARYRGVEPFAGVAYAFAPLYLVALEWRLWLGDASPFGREAGGVADADPASLVVWAAALASCIGLLTRKSTQGALVNVAVTWLGMGYVVGFASCYLRLRHLSLPNPWGLDWAATGMELVFVTVFTTKMADIGALLVGRRFGKRKLIPRLSPGKTWEGFFGGVLASMAFMAALITLEPAMAMRALGYPTALALAALLAVVGTAGDLVESAFKRDNAAKDAGQSIPGFGGMLDLLDSPLMAGPFMWLALVAIRSGGVAA